MTAIPRTTPTVGPLTRFRIQQPVRFFTWPAIAVLVVSLAVAVALPFSWWVLASAVLSVVCLVCAVEAARFSVLSPADVVRALRESPRV